MKYFDYMKPNTTLYKTLCYSETNSKCGLRLSNKELSFFVFKHTQKYSQL